MQQPPPRSRPDKNGGLQVQTFGKLNADFVRMHREISMEFSECNEGRDKNKFDNKSSH